MIYNELKIRKTPLGLKKTSHVSLCERTICGHIIYKIDLLPSIFEYMVLITRTTNLATHYPKIRESVVTLLTGDCSDAEYTEALMQIYENSPLFEAYFNYHYIMRRDKISLKELVIPLVSYVLNVGSNLMVSVKGTYMAENSGYLYILDAYKPALAGYSYVEIR